MNHLLSKDEIRKRIWMLMEKRNIALFPRPVYGRIPNFVGADKAAEKLLYVKEFIDAKVVKVNPDSPQKYVRLLTLKLGKKLIMPTPRIKKGFLLIDPSKIRNYNAASTIKGALRYGTPIHPSKLPRIDFIVEGSVAVSKDCNRLGKGEGYSEIEYAILLEHEKIDPDIPIATTIHDIQIVEYIPRDPYDVSIDYILTPKTLIRCKRQHIRPNGIIWDIIEKDKIFQIPLLRELYEQRL